MVAGGWRFHRAHGATLRRARALCLAADLLDVRRPRGWQPRGARLYRRAARDLGRIADAVAPPAPDVDPAPRAHQLLRLCQAPYRRALLALAGLAAGLLFAVALVGSLACLVSPRLRGRLFPRDLAARASWVASSAVPPNPQSGVGPATDRHDLFFHSVVSDHPWIEIDLGATRVIRSLRVENRRDCCQERALPINFEVFDESSGQWRAVVQRRSAFEVWTRSFPAVRARRVRVRLAGTGILHLRRISVYEW
ncbi:MAG TPA: discoidin domain-containing protein [Polyangia bacterium]|nr:discoidin domain-containing protein [Polyangia bacterium]